MVVSFRELSARSNEVPAERPPPGVRRGHSIVRNQNMKPDSEGMPNDVLIVEDDPLIALDFEDRILGFGVKSVRATGSVAGALDLIADRLPDFVLLDVALVGEKSFAVAERLDALEIPFVFITGYGREAKLPAAFASNPVLPKPCSSDALEGALRQRARR